MKLYRYITIMIIAVIAWSCETPMLIDPAEVPHGIYVTFVPGNTNINSEDVEGTPITGTFDAPSDNVASHAINVKRIYNNGDDESEYVLLETITTFPYDFSVDGNELAALFGVPVDETFANFYQFNCIATGKNGDVATYDNLHNDLIASPEQLQGFRFRGAVVCPSDPNVIVGTYSSIASGQFPDFGDYTDITYTIEISATEDEGFYDISDCSFGTFTTLYGGAGWWAGDGVPGTIQDVCGNFFITNTLDVWGDTMYGDFTFNMDGTITVVGGSSYGETWTAVLTKQ